MSELKDVVVFDCDFKPAYGYFLVDLPKSGSGIVAPNDNVLYAQWRLKCKPFVVVCSSVEDLNVGDEVILTDQNVGDFMILTLKMRDGKEEKFGLVAQHLILGTYVSK